MGAASRSLSKFLVEREQRGIPSVIASYASDQQHVECLGNMQPAKVESYGATLAAGPRS